jgi:hypothetical protein
VLGGGCGVYIKLLGGCCAVWSLGIVVGGGWGGAGTGVWWCVAVHGVVSRRGSIPRPAPGMCACCEMMKATCRTSSTALLVPLLQVVVAEGAPRYDGHTLAVKLASAGVQTTVISDSSVFAMMARANKVLVGAHAVLANGGVIAPSGIHMVALAAKRHSIPFVVLVGLHKLSPAFPHDPDVMLNDFKSPAAVVDYDVLAECFAAQQEDQEVGWQVQQCGAAVGAVDWVAAVRVLCGAAGGPGGGRLGGAHWGAGSRVVAVVQCLLSLEDQEVGSSSSSSSSSSSKFIFLCL